MIRFRQGLTRQFARLMIIFIAIFLLGSALVLGLQLSKQSELNGQLEALEEKADQIALFDRTYRDTLLQFRGYYAFDNEELRDRALNNEPVLLDAIEAFGDSVTTDADEEMYLQGRATITQLFDTTIPQSLAFYEAGETEQLQAVHFDVAPIVNGLLESLADYRQSLQTEIQTVNDDLSTYQWWSQVGMFSFVLIMLIILLAVTITTVKRIKDPLSELALSAERVTNGEQVSFSEFDQMGDNEIALLAGSLREMTATLRANEEVAVDRTMELEAQQTELEEQQHKLQQLIGEMSHRETETSLQNQLISRLSLAKNIDTMLKVILTSFLELLRSDRGVVMLFETKRNARWGVTDAGFERFKQYMENGMMDQLAEKREPILVRRTLVDGEAGFHQETQHAHDLFLPVFSTGGTLTGVLAFARLGTLYSEEEVSNYWALTQQVAIALEKAKLFERSESDRQLNEDIINTIHEGIQLIRHDGMLLQVNKRFCEMYGIEDGTKCAGKPFDVWVDMMRSQIDDGDLVIGRFLSQIERNTARSISESYTLTSNGVRRTIHVYLEQLFRGEEMVGWVIVHRDMTAEFEADQLKSELVGTVSHELRTPLASILGFTEMMLHRELKPERQKKYLQTIYSESQRLTSLINDFLDLQRMESGKQEYNMTPLHLDQLLTRVAENAQGSTSLHRLHVNVSGSLMIHGDEDKIIQVLQNLVSNAIKYSPEGGDIRLTGILTGKHVQLSIQDEGLGIPEKALPQLFTKFYRVDNSDRRNIGGTGLGLSIVKEIVDRHGGSVTVESALGAGSTFTLLFPASNPEVVQAVETYAPPESSTIASTVLLVEDDDMMASLIRSELVSEGFEVVFCRNAAAAINWLATNAVDAAVIDLTLGHDQNGGVRVITHIKETESLKGVPIFISSALDQNESTAKLDVYRYLVKPYSPSHLSESIRHVLWLNGKVDGEIHIPDHE